mmetsp:Transcript_27118/g.64830  ORF Transcript_27118/g.64830 Transcript_27118/m.64830 type:complete len:100 (+) Transcript_27118:2280-2579(+)
MAPQYMGTDYDLLRKNCCSFAKDACVQLGIRQEEIPSWFHNLAQTGAMTHDSFSSVFASCEMDTHFARYINDAPSGGGVEVIEGSAENGHEAQVVDSSQ